MIDNELEQLNAEIRGNLKDILSKAKPDLQLELVDLIQEIHRINHLICNCQEGWFSKLSNSKNKEMELLSWLQEIKGMLMIIAQGNVDVEAVREFRINVKKNINKYQYSVGGYLINFVLNVYYVKSNPLKTLIGLIITLLIATVVVGISANYHWHSLQSEKKNTPSQVITPKPSQTHSGETVITDFQLPFSLVYAAAAGVLGSVTSILLRITKFRNQQYNDPLMPFFIGMFKPLIGLMLGIFIFALINSETIIKIDFLFSNPSSSLVAKDQESKRIFFIISCAFVIGFSERLASDLLSKVETKVEQESGLKSSNKTEE